MANWYGHTVSSAAGAMLVGAAPNSTYNGLTNTIASKSMYIANTGAVTLPGGATINTANFFSGQASSSLFLSYANGDTRSLYLAVDGKEHSTLGNETIDWLNGTSDLVCWSNHFGADNSKYYAMNGSGTVAQNTGYNIEITWNGAARFDEGYTGTRGNWTGGTNSLTIGNVVAASGTSSAVLSSTGGLLLSGLAVRYEDAQVQITQAKQGLIDHPPWNYATGTLDFPQNDPSEYVEFNVQFPHSRQLGSPIHPHVHWLQSANQQVTWVLDYDHIPAGGTASAPYGTRVTMTTNAYSYSSGTLSQLTGTATGLMLTGDTASSILRCKLYRSDNVYSGAAPVTAIDFHYHVDTPGGSATIGAK